MSASPVYRGPVLRRTTKKVGRAPRPDPADRPDIRANAGLLWVSSRRWCDRGHSPASRSGRSGRRAASRQASRTAATNRATPSSVRPRAAPRRPPQHRRVGALDREPDAGPAEHRARRWACRPRPRRRRRAARGRPAYAARLVPFVTPAALISRRTSSALECVTVTRCATCSSAWSRKLSASWPVPSTRASSFTTRRPDVRVADVVVAGRVADVVARHERVLVAEVRAALAGLGDPLRGEADRGQLGAQRADHLVERLGRDRVRVEQRTRREVDHDGAVGADRDAGVAGGLGHRRQPARRSPGHEDHREPGLAGPGERRRP